MGLKDFFVTAPTPIADINIDAALAPVNSIDALGAPYFAYGQSATRSEAMGVPVIARARGIICSTVASLPLVVQEPVELAGVLGRAWDSLRLWIK